VADPIPVFDGHNDTLLWLRLPGRGQGDSFFAHNARGCIDLPRALAGGFQGGFFAIFTPRPSAWETGIAEPIADLTMTASGYSVRMADPIDYFYARETTLRLIQSMRAIESDSAGRVRVVTSTPDFAACLAGAALAMVLHFEGAEAIAPDLHDLDEYYNLGLRSLGLVWSRPNAFGYGVPFQYPASPDTGPGLTEAGRELVRACNQLGIMIDLAHINEQGFWDVAGMSSAPLVVTHAGAHALCPVTRNLTDRQLDAIGATGGVIGVVFDVSMTRPDGDRNRDTPISVIADHIEYIAQRIGIDHVAFGSDFDGATMPDALPDAAHLPDLLETLRGRGFDDKALRKIAHENWLRVLRQTWK
jgi:membrane dipeptidase